MRVLHQNVIRGSFLMSLLISLSMSPSSGAEIDRSQPEARKFQTENETKGRASTIDNLARERYRFLKRLEPKVGCFPLWDTGFQHFIALFPIERSDRVYLILLGIYWPPGPRLADQKSLLLCYQRKDGKDKLVYKIGLLWTGPAASGDRVSKAGAGSTRILERLKASDEIVRGAVSNFAKADLAADRDYAQYTYVPYIDALFVWRASDAKRDIWYGEGAKAYDIYKDPFSKAELKPGEFYKRYGLPRATGE